MSNSYKKGHPILAVVLGLLGLSAAVMLTLFTGVVGGVIAGVLGLAALLIGLKSKKDSGKGLGGIIIGVLAIILAITMTATTVKTFTLIKNEIAKYADEAPLVAKSLDQPSLGLLGMLMNLPKDEGSIQELMDQFKLIEEKVKITNVAQ